jgi:hypothetical protein
MLTNHPLRFVPGMLLFVFVAALRAEDRTSIVETPLAWHSSPFQEGYSWPGGSFNKSIYKGAVTIVLDRDEACERIDRAFQKLGFRMKRDVAYRRDGVAFRVTGYDVERKVGYLWATPETLGEGFFGRPPESSDEEKAIRLTAAEAKMLEDRAPATHEFIAIVIPYTHRLGYMEGFYRNDEEKAAFEKRRADTAGKRLASLDKAVGDYVQWVAARRAEEYPAPSPEPRNLLAFARWQQCRARPHIFGECGVGQPRPLPDTLVRKSIESWSAEAKIDLTLPHVYQTKGASLKLTGFDPKRKIGYIWDYPPDNPRRLKEIASLAAQAQVDGLRIAWISPADTRFDNAGAPELTRFAPPYAGKRGAISKISDPADRAEAIRKLNEEVARDNARPALSRLERRMREFAEYAGK